MPWGSRWPCRLVLLEPVGSLGDSWACHLLVAGLSRGLVGINWEPSVLPMKAPLARQGEGRVEV